MHKFNCEIWNAYCDECMIDVDSKWSNGFLFFWGWQKANNINSKSSKAVVFFGINLKFSDIMEVVIIHNNISSNLAMD
jgi:hypothetical protein